MAEDKRTSQPFEVIEYQGQEARRYPNGVIRSPKGYILSVPSRVAQEMARQRYIIGEEKAREGIKLATMSETPEEGVMKIIRAKTIVAMTDNGRAGNEAARLVLTQAGYMDKKSSVTETNNQVNVLQPLPKAFLDYIRKQSEAESIEGKVLDNDTDG